MIKKLLFVSGLLVTGVLVLYLLGVYQNNRDVSYPQRDQLQQHYDLSISWLVNHEDVILNQANPMLWWMLHEAYKLSNDARIAILLQKYMQRNSRIVQSVWAPLFDYPGRRSMGGYAVEGLPYYNQHFIYALNCSQDIADDIAIVEQQNDAGFCHQARYFYRPACITHQLMGINFLYTNKCGLLPDIDEVIQSLQQDIVTQLSWDFRVVDVYLQRVMMLLITGAESSVKPVWIERVLEQQLPDGGWGGFVSLIDISQSMSIGLGPRILQTGQEKSDFHATAQGVLILAYLLN